MHSNYQKNTSQIENNAWFTIVKILKLLIHQQAYLKGLFWDRCFLIYIHVT